MSPTAARAAAAVAAAAAIALVVALLLAGPGGPTVVQAAELSLRPSSQAAPPPRAGQPAVLQRSFAGVDYPNWSNTFGWQVEGVRNDELGGRETQTVFYRHTHKRIGYTVISGRAIEPPDDAETLTVGGVELHRFRLGRVDGVSFERGGRTCVLSGMVHDPDTLAKLASWGAEGALRD